MMLHTENHTRLRRNARLRPIRSAIRPKAAAPMNIPTNDEAINSCSAVPPKPYSVLSAVAMVLDRKISYTSKKRPSPIATTILRWTRPTGSRSRRRPMSSSPTLRSGCTSAVVISSLRSRSIRTSGCRCFDRSTIRCCRGKTTRCCRDRTIRCCRGKDDPLLSCEDDPLLSWSDDLRLLSLSWSRLKKFQRLSWSRCVQ